MELRSDLNSVHIAAAGSQYFTGYTVRYFDRSLISHDRILEFGIPVDFGMNEGVKRDFR